MKENFRKMSYPTRNRSERLLQIFLFTLLATTLLVSTSFGEINKDAGTTGFSFLKLGVGARAVAMGGAYAASSNDPAVLYYNPAGLGYLEGRIFMAGYHNYVMDLQSGYLALTTPFKGKYKLGLFIDYMNFGDFVKTDIDGKNIGDFSGGDFLIGAGVATQINSMASIGLNLKFMSEYADGYSSQAMAVDLGVMVRFRDSLTQVGLSIYNLGTVLSGFSAAAADPHEDKLPMGIRAGVQHSLRELPLIVNIDGILPNDNDPYMSFGAEFFKFEPLYLRVGYSLFGENYKTGSGSDGLGGMAFGFGLDLRDYHLGYAYVPYLDLGSSHRMTISGQF